MDSPRPAVDLEKELTCSICTELLYQPLTLLDCLHTFCGACLKEWFSWQAAAAENAQSPPAPGAPVFTCPACRAPVRDTRHNATVATLLDMFLAANPDKAKTDDEKEEMNKKYKPGDRVIPKLNIAEKTPEQRRLEEEERRLIREVRELSLREAVAGSGASQSSSRRRRDESRSGEGRTRRSRDPSRESRNTETRARDTRERERRRQAADEENRRRAEQNVLLQPETASAAESRRHRSESRQRGDDASEMRRRHIEHQSSLRSLISSSDVGSLDIEREVEEFARQIQEEGLLDGLDLDNIDLTNNDELSRRITEAYRRRQRERSRHETGRRSNASSPGHQRQRQLYPEPSITCSRCGREHIEYELYYNCTTCKDGDWNICLTCYRQGKGCLYWFGFGDAGWAKWEAARKTDPTLPEPHRLWAVRYLQPKRIPGGAEGRKTLTTEDPEARLQSGAFCARCLVWANECYWRCGVCNDADWGFCNDCVNQGRSCTHPLLPLTYQPAQSTGTPPQSPPRSPIRPSSASIMTGPNALSFGSFRPLTFTTRCDICRVPIPPAQSRYHCYWCVSSLVPDSKPGDYDICQRCYPSLVATKTISVENGPDGWRRCPQGHRMVVVGFQDGKGGQWRNVVQDLVGGRKLQIANVDDAALLQYYWYELEERPQESSTEKGHHYARRERLVAKDVSATATPAASPSAANAVVPFPPDGGTGWRATARWAWYPAPGADDELLFPRGAEIREIEDVNGEWYHGVYMGTKGLFPAPYVRILDGGS
ncbi:RING finger domain-containing protein [Pleurostoma richardsiae]|uniref:RING finger domain-containing protein n=1 Tax=Pleurostoma richardsiae TaxID=41990 RepID=A0AA38VV48_9PEZI|nr:RING finger domain-containing protein [Pleurostoma richardsiae]